MLRYFPVDLYVIDWHHHISIDNSLASNCVILMCHLLLTSFMQVVIEFLFLIRARFHSWQD